LVRRTVIPSQAEIKRAVEGALLLARANPAGMTRFDFSVDGFWRSFSAILIAAPAYLLLLVDRYSTTGLGAHIGAVAMVEALAYVIGWCAFPVAAIFLTRMLGLGGRYVALVVAGNWCGVLQVLLLAAAVLLGSLLPQTMRGVVGLATLIAVLTYQWFVIRTALETTSGTAAALVLVDILLSMLVHEGADALLQVG
jgi:hypothetical protein